MKRLRKMAAVFMILLLITTSFTYSVHADDNLTADDSSSTTAEVVEQNDEEIPTEENDEEISETIETIQTEEATEEPVAEETNEGEEDTEEDRYYLVSYMFANVTAKDGIGSLPDEIMDLLPEKEEVKDINSYEPKYPKETDVSGILTCAFFSLEGSNAQL